jgi:hypothetical protein
MQVKEQLFWLVLIGPNCAVLHAKRGLFFFAERKRKRKRKRKKEICQNMQI